MISKTAKLPRLYSNQALAIQDTITLEEGHAHYLNTVLRCQPCDFFRIFNGRDGEFVAEILDLKKKNGQALIKEQIKKQTTRTTSTHLLFAPIKKHRMDFLIEKSVELGVTDLHPVITSNCEVRKINTKRLEAQITEAVEQCERLDMPILHAEKQLNKILSSWDDSIPLYVCLERSTSSLIQEKIIQGNAGFLIGPEGGFDEHETSMILTHKKVTPVCLGDEILRSETAALACLALKKFK